MKPSLWNLKIIQILKEPQQVVHEVPSWGYVKEMAQKNNGI